MSSKDSSLKPDVPKTPEDRRALIAIDLGAESCRVSLLRWQDSGTPKIQLVHRFGNSCVERNGELCWDLAFILEELQHGLTLCGEIAGEGVRSVGVDGWAVDYVRLDGNGVAVRAPFCYRDERTLRSEKALHQRISPDRMRALTGLQLMRINTAYQFFADAVELRGARWLNLPEYVLYTLGAYPVAELTNASHTQLLGLDGRWNAEIFEAIGAPLSRAPHVVPPGTDVGRLNSALTNHPSFASTRLIAPACHDTASAIAAIPDPGSDWAYISSGTWSLVGTVLESPNNTPAACSENFTNLRGVDDMICFHKSVSGMWLLRECMENWRREAVTRKLPLPEIGTLIEAASAFPNKGYALDLDDPEFLLPGNMQDRINRQLHYRGLEKLDATLAGAAEFTSFVLHSLAARYSQVLSSLAEITGKRFARLYVVGGGSQNALLNRLTAEATGLEVTLAGIECSTRGNFAVQLAALESMAGSARHPVHNWAELLSQSNCDH